MSVDKLVDSTQLDADLTSVANAIRTKGGTSASLAFPADFVQAIQDIPTGGSITVEVGTFKVISDIDIATSGTNVTIGFSGHPDYIYCWMDKDTFDAISSPVNNRWYRWSLAKNNTAITDTFPPIRMNASKNVQTDFGASTYIRTVGWNVNTTTDPNSVNGYTQTALAYSGTNVSSNAINNDGTITISRGSSACPVLAGDYHYIAITGVSMFQI